MDAATGGPGTDGLTEEQRNDPRFVEAVREGGGDPGRTNVAHAAQGAELTDGEERSALDWMLGGPVNMEHVIPADYETPAGMLKVKFVTRMLDSRVLDEIQQRHVNDTTGKLDKLSVDVEIVARATKYLTDPTGRQVPLDSEEYLTVRRKNSRGEEESVKLASPHDALEYHWKGQEGVLSGVSDQITKTAGYSLDRVGAAQRRLVDAALG